MLDIRCEERLEDIRAFAKKEGIEDKLTKTLDYLKTYTPGCTAVLYYDFAPNSMGVDMKTRDGRTMWVGGVIYNGNTRDWGVHT